MRRKPRSPPDTPGPPWTRSCSLSATCSNLPTVPGGRDQGVVLVRPGRGGGRRPRRVIRPATRTIPCPVDRPGPLRPGRRPGRPGPGPPGSACSDGRPGRPCVGCRSLPPGVFSFRRRRSRLHHPRREATTLLTSISRSAVRLPSTVMLAPGSNDVKIPSNVYVVATESLNTSAHVDPALGGFQIRSNRAAWVTSAGSYSICILSEPPSGRVARFDLAGESRCVVSTVGTFIAGPWIDTRCVRSSSTSWRSSIATGFPDPC